MRRKREKNILEAERQLANATPTTSTTPDPETEIIIPLSQMADKRMVLPGSKDAPKFKSSAPQELRRFIRLMEDLWKEASIDDDKVKKQMIGKYADQSSEEEWAAFDSYDSGSWAEFKAELIQNYPEAAAAERGTPARIRQICSETDKIVLGDMPALYSFRRAFLSEAKKLQKDPPAMANRELVELFISCLSDSLASAVLQFLGNKSSSRTTRRPEDKYDLEEVCKAALQVSENSQGMFNLMNKSQSRGMLLFSQPVPENRAFTDKLSALEGEQALERDRLISLDKTLNARMGGLEEMMKTLLKMSEEGGAQNACKGDCKNGSCKSHETVSSPAQRWGGKPLESEKCFWCGKMGHFQADCDDLKNQVRLGNIKMNQEGKLRLKDGSFIPKYPAEACLKERAEKHYAKNPSQFFYGDYEENDSIQSTGKVACHNS